MTLSQRNFSKKQLGEKKAKPLSKQRKLNQIITWVLIVVCGVLIISFSDFIIAATKNIVTSITKSTVKLASQQMGTPMKIDENGNVNIFLVGYGGEGHQGGYLTDSLMVASRNPESGNITMISLPRDLYVKYNHSNGAGRINGIFTQLFAKNHDYVESASGLARKVEEITGLKIPYYATIDFGSFKDIVDAIGGIDVYVPDTIHDTTYPDENMRGYKTFHLDAGQQHLNGATALMYARSRHSTSDFSRSLRQQIIINGIKDKLMGSGVDVSSAQNLYNQYMKYVHTNVTLPEMLWTVQFLENIKPFKSFGYTTECSQARYQLMKPGCFLYTPNRDQFGGASVMLPNGGAAGHLSEYGATSKFGTYVIQNQEALNKNLTLEIQNGISKDEAKVARLGSAQFAGQLATKLKRYGFNIFDAKNADVPVSGTTLVVNTLEDVMPLVPALQEFLSISQVVYNTGALITGLDYSGNVISLYEGPDLTLILGSDYLSGYVQKKFSYEL